MSNSHVNPAFRGLLDAISSAHRTAREELRDGLTELLFGIEANRPQSTPCSRRAPDRARRALLAVQGTAAGSAARRSPCS